MLDPQPLATADWAEIGAVLTYLVLGVALAVNAAAALLLSYAVLPSLAATADISPDLLWVRRLSVPIGLVAAALTLLALSRGLSLAVEVVQRIYPRFAI
jgi:hypothetical protein